MAKDVIRIKCHKCGEINLHFKGVATECSKCGKLIQQTAIHIKAAENEIKGKRQNCYTCVHKGKHMSKNRIWCEYYGAWIKVQPFKVYERCWAKDYSGKLK